MRRQYLITMFLMGLSLPFGGNIVRLAEAAALCYTKDGPAKEGALMAPSLAGMKNVLSIMESGDMVAYDQLFAQRRAMRVPAGTPVFVEETVELFRRIRLKGTVDSVWTHAFYLTCPK